MCIGQFHRVIHIHDRYSTESTDAVRSNAWTSTRLGAAKLPLNVFKLYDGLNKTIADDIYVISTFTCLYFR